MRQSKLFFKTVKNISSEIKVTSHKFLYKGGFIRESVAGRYYMLPLGMIVRDKISRIIEEEMNKAGAIKIIAPVLHPIELWKETNRTDSVGFELMTIKDRNNSEFALGGTAEEMMVDLIRKWSVSYRDLPVNIYQFSPKFRDEARARGGLLRVREFVMKDAYSFHVDETDFKREYAVMWETYSRIYNRVGLNTVVVEADNGYIGGDYCHEFVVECEAGESRFLTTANGEYAAHEDVAKFKKEIKNVTEEEKSMIEVQAEHGCTMEDGVKFHGLPDWRQIKDVMFIDDKGRYILAVIRGDYDVNETKLMHHTKANDLRHATEEEIRAIGSEPGFITPVGINKDVIVVADDSLRTIKNAFGGSNRKNVDLLNVNIDRDWKPTIEADIAMAADGYLTESGLTMKESKGIEVGNIFQLGLHYSSKMKATFMDSDGQEKFYYMGCYGIGVDRTMATVVEKNSDDRGIIWPESIAPYRIHLVELNSKDIKIHEKAIALYDELVAAGVDILYDDREEVTAGEKFTDADLIGCPWRVIVSERSLQSESAEIKSRKTGESELVKLVDVVARFKN